MPIRLLQIQNFRNLNGIEMQPCAGINVIAGENGSGKTSILEAIHYLGSARSFRTTASATLLKHNTEKFNIFAEVTSFDQVFRTGHERCTTGETRIRLSDKDLNSITALVRLIPLRVINANTHQLLESGPSFRRKYLDWGVFYQDESFLPTWRFFERSLKQRNLLLKERRLKEEIHAWTQELVKHGEKLHQLRRSYVDVLRPDLLEMSASLLQLAGLEVSYCSGWKNDCTYASVLEDHFWEDHRAGMTVQGPHRADLELMLDNVLMKHFLSRGQQKLLICAMILAQGMTFSKTANKQLTYLIDDLPAELDAESRQRLITLLAEQSSQIFITAIESVMITELTSTLGLPVKVFHVKHGELVGSDE